MILLLTVLLSLYVSFFFFIIRKLNDKWREIVSYTTAYLLLLIGFIACIYVELYWAQTKGSARDYFTYSGLIKDVVTVTLLYCILPSFVISYLLYPFKIIKRNKILIWVLSILALIIPGFTTLLEVAHLFSNM